MKAYRLLTVLALGAALASCSEKLPDPGKIEMEFQFENIPVDLNVADNPYILCVINSETELESVSMAIVHTDGTKEPYKNAITDFYKSTLCTIHERPVYDETMAGFEVTATDKGGAVATGTVTFTITPVATAPVAAFVEKELKFAEGDPIPEFSFSVEASAPLVSVSVDLIESGTLTELLPPFEIFETPLAFSFHSTGYALADYDVNKIPSSIRVTAVDTYGKKTISLLPIDYKALPSPEISVGEVPAVNEFTACTVSGHASSETGITRVTVYATGEGYEQEVAHKDYETVQACDYSISVDGDEIREYVSALKVVATDARNKKSSASAPLNVTPVPWPVGPSENLLNVIKSQEENAKYRSIKLALSPGAVYDLGSSSYTITKNLYLVCEGASQAQIKTSASYTFLTSSAVADSIRFSNVRFSSTKSGAGLFNNSGGCDIGKILVDGCTFDGTFSGPFIRLAGNCVIGSIVVENCIIKWANTSGSYAFFHMTQGSDKVASLRLADSTVSGVFYLWYCNLANSTIGAEILNNTFVNQKGSSNGYHISFGASSLKGNLTMRKNLYGGSNNIAGGYRMLRANSISAVTEDNWCTKSWKTFSDDATNSSVNFLSILPDSEDNDGIFTDLSSFDLTIKAGTSVKSSGIGDPRWLK